MALTLACPASQQLEQVKLILRRQRRDVTVELLWPHPKVTVSPPHTSTVQKGNPTCLSARTMGRHVMQPGSECAAVRLLASDPASHSESVASVTEDL